MHKNLKPVPHAFENNQTQTLLLLCSATLASLGVGTSPARSHSFIWTDQRAGHHPRRTHRPLSVGLAKDGQYGFSCCCQMSSSNSWLVPVCRAVCLRSLSSNPTLCNQAVLGLGLSSPGHSGFQRCSRSGKREGGRTAGFLLPASSGTLPSSYLEYRRLASRLEPPLQVSTTHAASSLAT